MSEHACKVCGNLGRPLGDYLGKNVDGGVRLPALLGSRGLEGLGG